MTKFNVPVKVIGGGGGGGGGPGLPHAKALFAMKLGMLGPAYKEGG